MRWMFSFGRMIGNTDMHFGNLSLFADTQTGRYRLAPAYDVLPMLYAPIGNEVVERTNEESAVPHPDALDTWKQAVGAAASFWRKVADHPQISSEFRDIAQENLSFFPREAARPVPSIS